MLEKKINYSIVIPHYNIPYLLKRCLDSIEYRDDVEVIVVDDCSDDFASFPKSDYSSVRFIEQDKNGRAGVCRNRALEEVEGKWVLFVDADDFLLSGYMALLDEYVSSDNDVVYFDYKAVLSDDVSEESKNYRKSIISMDKDEEYTEMYLRYVFGPPWAKMVRRELLQKHRIQFDTCYKHEDTMFSLKVGLFAKSIAISKGKLCANTYRDDSMTTIREKDVKRYVDCVYDVELRYRSMAKEYGIEEVKWRLFYAIENSLRTERYTVCELFRYFKRNGLLVGVLLKWPIYFGHRLIRRYTNSKYLY